MRATKKVILATVSVVMIAAAVVFSGMIIRGLGSAYLSSQQILPLGQDAMISSFASIAKLAAAPAGSLGMDDLSNASRIYISSGAEKTLEDAWSGNAGVEFKYCMHVRRYQDSYIIYELYRPRVGFANDTLITAEDCDDVSAGYIHSHPNGDCLMSRPDNSASETVSDLQDLYRERYPIAGIMCDPQRIAIYTKANHKSSVQLIMVEDDGTSKDITVSNPCRNSHYCNDRCWDLYNEDKSDYRWTCTPQGGVWVEK